MLLVLKMAAFLVVAPCSLVKVCQLFRGTCCLHHQRDDSTRLHGAITQKTSHVHTRRQNLKSCAVYFICIETTYLQPLWMLTINGTFYSVCVYRKIVTAQICYIIRIVHYFAGAIIAVTKLHTSRPRKRYTPPPPWRAALSQQYNVASFDTLRVLSCLHSPGLRCSCCNVAWLYCDLEACNLVTATIVRFTWLWNVGKNTICRL
jgi:hypothetical protein